MDRRAECTSHFGAVPKMRAGLRLQVLLLLGALLTLAFVPLHAAVSAYVAYAVRDLRSEASVALTEAAAAHLEEARHAGRSEFTQVLKAQSDRDGIEAIALYDEHGRRTAIAGLEPAFEELPTVADVVPLGSESSVKFLGSGDSPIARVVVPIERGAVVALVRPEGDAVASRPVVKLIGLYMGLVALALLVFSYFALTRMIVRPLDRLTRAAERVAGGARRLELPDRSPRELTELGESLHNMTETLLTKEQRLREHVDELERKGNELRAAQQTLIRTERLASVGRLSAGLAHEIGNPLAALIGMQDLLIDGDLPAVEGRDFLQRMRRETERIHGILGDLLQFARPSAGATGAAAEGYVPDAVSDTLALLTPQKELRELTLVTRLAPSLPRVGISREQLVQVLLNLLLNAADACGDGATITVRATATDGECVVVEVEDDGPGVAGDMRARLFEPFVTSKGVGQGTGLGLAVCRGLVESVGGSITLDETYVGGARFVVTLPVAPRPSGSPGGASDLSDSSDLSGLSDSSDSSGEA